MDYDSCKLSSGNRIIVKICPGDISTITINGTTMARSGNTTLNINDTMTKI
jgi:hypothetical protein